MKTVTDLENLILKEIENYIEAAGANLEAGEFVVPPFPEEQKIYSLQEFEDYKKKKSEYDSAVDQKHCMYEESKVNLIKARKQVISLLPAGNTWFKIGNYYVGYETDDWPTGEPSFFLEKDVDESDLKVLKHRIIN